MRIRSNRLSLPVYPKVLNGSRSFQHFFQRIYCMEKIQKCVNISLSLSSPVNGLVRFVMRRKLVSLSSSVRVILFFFFTGSSLLMAVGIFGPAISGSDSMLFVSPKNMFRLLNMTLLIQQPSSRSLKGSELSIRGAMSGTISLRLLLEMETESSRDLLAPHPLFL